MKTLSEVQRRIDYLCGPTPQVGETREKAPSRYRAEVIFLQYIKIILESKPTEDFINKQIEHNQKRLRSIQSEIAAISDYSGISFQDIEKDKKFANAIKMIENQNKMLNFILGNE